MIVVVVVVVINSNKKKKYTFRNLVGWKPLS